MKKIIRSKLQITLLSVLLLMVCILFTSLSLADEKTAPNENETEINEEKVIESFEGYDASNIPLISAIADKNIYLYGIKPTGAVLYVDGRGHYYDWDYLTPRFVLPEMQLGDFDEDGKEELAVILYVGSGTGYAVEELHIVEISEDEMLSIEPSHKDYLKPNPEYFVDRVFMSESYISQLNELVKIKVPKKGDELMVDVIVDEKHTVINLQDYQSDDANLVIKDTPAFGNIVYFNVIDGKLTANFALGIATDSFATPIYIGEVFADVSYTEGDFDLSNLRFEIDEAFSKKDE